MIDRAHPLPVARQARLLWLSRSSVYYEPVPRSAADLALMTAMDAIHMELPFYGIRRIRGELRDRGLAVGRQHVATLMRTMGIEALASQAPAPRSPSPATRSTPTFCETWTSPPPAKCGAPTSRICRWRGASAISWRSWTGRADECSPGGSRTR